MTAEKTSAVGFEIRLGSIFKRFAFLWYYFCQNLFPKALFAKCWTYDFLEQICYAELLTVRLTFL